MILIYISIINVNASVNVRSYGLPEKYEEETNKQIKKMLEEKIIQYSTSQWNALIDRSKKKKD